MGKLKLNDKGETGCCPKFDPTPWENKILEWKDKKFVKGKVWTFMFMPINFGKVISSMMEKIKAAGAESDVNLCLSDHTSKWNMNIFIAVSKEVEGLKNVKLSGRFLSRVYEGPFKDTAKWCKDYESYVQEKGYKIDKWYMSYTTCPACAKIYGKNYVLIIAKLTD